MSTIDNSGSSQGNFAGDGSGNILDNPDLVMQSPITSDRVVDTQSGFLVIVRRAQERLGISLRRRLGTPPQSQILLTPDECIKLARILSDSWPTGKPKLADARANDLGHSTHDIVVHRPTESDGPQGFKPVVLVMVVLALCNFGAGSFAGYFAHQPKVEVIDPLAQPTIDHFSRNFVSSLLDFNPDTYKTSQIRAMAEMTPELQTTYWSDTNFPLTPEQLAALGQKSKLEIGKVDCQKIDAQTASADVQGEMIEDNGSKSTPVHLQLKLNLDSDNQIKVVEQNDLTSVPIPNAAATEEPKPQTDANAVHANVP